MSAPGAQRPSSDPPPPEGTRPDPPPPESTRPDPPPPEAPHGPPSSGRAWWRHYFDAEWLAQHEPLFGAEESRREVGAMLDLLGLPAGSRVLDLPCGWGRHTRLLPQAALEAWGADLSFPLLERAAADLRAAAHPIRLAAADMRLLPFADGSFDAVINVFTSLGLFERDEEDLRALAEAKRVLRPGGRFLLESMHRDDVVAAYASRDGWTLPDGTEIRVRRRFDPVSGVSRERWRWRRGEERGEKRHALRLRTATELRELVLRAGFGEPRIYGDWDGSRLRRRSPRAILVAEPRTTGISEPSPPAPADTARSS